MKGNGTDGRDISTGGQVSSSSGIMKAYIIIIIFRSNNIVIMSFFFSFFLSVEVCISTGVYKSGLKLVSSKEKIFNSTNQDKTKVHFKKFKIKGNYAKC